MKRKNNILAMLMAVLMVIAMLPAVAQEAYAGEHPVDFTQYINGLQDGNLVRGSTISVDVEKVCSDDKNTEMMEAFLEAGNVDVSLHTFAPGGMHYFDYDSSSGISTLNVNGDMVKTGTLVEVIISIDEENFYTTGIYAVDKNTLDVKGKTASVKYSKLRKKAQYLGVSKVISFADEGQGEKTYSLASAVKSGKSYKKYFIVNSATGKVTVKKGLKKGTYTVKVNVSAAGETKKEVPFYLPVTKTVKFKIKVK